MSDWVRLDVKKLSPATQERIHGVDITVVMSPYDVPEAVRGEYNKHLRRFVIEFRYLGDEPWNVVKQDENISLRVARHSGRLYGIEVNIDAMEASRVNLRLEVPHLVMNAIDNFGRRSRKPMRFKNYQVAKDAITQKKEQIFESLAMA